MPKIIAFSDIHCHNFVPYSTVLPNGLNSRLQDALNCIDQVRDYAVKVNAEMVLFGGDLFHLRRYVPTQVFNAVTDRLYTFVEAEMPLVAIPGNHDQSDKEGNWHALHTFGMLCTLIEETGWRQVVGRSGQVYNILGIPFTESREAVQEACKSAPPSLTKKLPRLLLAHLGVVGAQLGADFVYNNLADCSLEDLNTKAFDVALLGHFHLHQKLNKNTYYIGAPLQHNWGDRFQTRGFIEYDTNTRKVTQIECRAPKFIEVEDVEGWQDGQLDDSYVRLVSDEEYSIDRREEVRQDIGARSLEVVRPKVEREIVSRTSLTPGESYDKIISKYISEVGTELDADLLAEIGREMLKEVL